MYKFLFILVLIEFISCQDNTKLAPNNFKIGKYKTTLEDNNTTSMAVRNDSIQIETYKSKKDTFYIHWVNNFEYILLKKNPKTLLDSTPFHVKITAVKSNSYNFKAYYKGSKFNQSGKSVKISN